MADNITTILCRCHEIWKPNFLEPFGPLQACNGTALFLPTCFEQITVHHPQFISVKRIIE